MSKDNDQQIKELSELVQQNEIDFEKQLASIKIAQQEAQAAKDEKEQMNQECQELKRKIDLLEKQMVEKDEVSKEQQEKIAQLDDCLAEKNSECQVLFGSVQSM